MSQDDVDTGGTRTRRGNGKHEDRSSAGGMTGGASPDLQADLDRLRGDFTRLTDTVRQWSMGQTDTIAEQVRANPWRAIGIAFVAGLLLRPWLLGRERYYYYEN
jgi:ElaB/YqjD/DUF883 family membrane-anchored ribosome-binding protein